MASLKSKKYPQIIKSSAPVCMCFLTMLVCVDSESGLDRVVMALGKLGFIKEFSYFPVLYMDPEGQLAVFSFPPLNSNIAIRRIDK